MSLIAIYERFLASPNPLSLSDNAALHYVPTLTSFTEPGPVIRHLESQSKEVVKPKSFKTINAVQGPSSVALEVDTTLEFLSGGGAYLPRLENLVSGRVVNLPVTHIVHFDADQKISQIRISWDQGSLLLQTEVIGSRGRNWPVTDGKNQVKLIANSASNQPIARQPTAPTSPRGRSTEESGQTERNVSPSKRLVKDPYTSMDTYFVQQTIENISISQPLPAVVPPRAEPFKPAPRDITEILAPGLQANDPDSPTKSGVIAPKGGSNQKFGRNRILEENEEDYASPKIYKTNPARYNHFDLGELSEDDPFQYKKGESKAQDSHATRPVNANASKHTSQWDLTDFSTPQKVAVKERPDGKVHFTLDGDTATPTDNASKAAGGKPRRDAAANFELKDDGTPVERKVVPKPRKDTLAHFALEDRPTPAQARIIARTDAAKALYRDPLDHVADERPLADISNNAGRRNDFASSWDLNDDPAPAPSTINNENKGVAGHRHNKSWQNVNASWDAYDQPAEQERRPTSKDFKKGLQPQWGLGDEDTIPQAAAAAAPATKAGGPNKGFWDF
ncbi:hypothetical protein DV735_g2480, partial [Chaetothyriales sp. CBS 134920]